MSRQCFPDHRLLLDGAMGTMIQRYGLAEDDFRGSHFAAHGVELYGNYDALNITRPQIIEEIHRAYLSAGADIIKTNTFNSQRVSQAAYALNDNVEELNLAGARIAREVADEFAVKTGQPRFVAGSVGPTSKLLSGSRYADNAELRNAGFDELVAAYAEQMSALMRGGVDALLVETALDPLNAKAAIAAAKISMTEVRVELPLMLSVSVADSSGRVLSGVSIEEYAEAVAREPLFSIGLNCSIGAAAMREPLRRLAAIARCRVSAHPNAGLPDMNGSYPDTPEMMSAILREYVENGWADIIGGCCGTTPEHIAAFRRMLDAAR